MEYSSPCYTVGPYCLSIPYIIIYIFSPQTLTPCLPQPLQLGNHKSVLNDCRHNSTETRNQKLPINDCSFILGGKERDMDLPGEEAVYIINIKEILSRGHF